MKNKNCMYFFPHYLDAVNHEHIKWRWPNFKPSELKSNGDDSLLIHMYAMDCLQNLRSTWGAPLIINSAYRNPNYNKEIGGAPNSFHMRAMAFDISTSGYNEDHLANNAKACGFTGIIKYDTFIHVDVRDNPYEKDNRTSKKT